MIADPIRAMQTAVKEQLQSAEPSAKIEFDVAISSNAPWRPHVYERNSGIGWHLHPVEPDTDAWLKRIRRAKEIKSGLRVGIAATEEVLSPAFLTACFELNAQLILVKTRRDGFTSGQCYASVPDLICERQIRLDAATAKSILDLALQRALLAGTKAEKGVRLEIVVALILSQVDNFEVADVGISNRTQQMDVLVHNRAVGGVLAGSPIVLAEAKNWKNKVTPSEYNDFLRKIETRHRRAKLGFLVTTGSFTSGVASEIRRDSKGETLVVLVDGKALGAIWEGPESITKKVERLIITASVGK